MTTRIAPLSASLSVVAFLAWVALGEEARLELKVPPPPVEEVSNLSSPGAGSAVPCAVPLAWRIARVDPGFGIGIDAATAALRDAANLWREAVGFPLFTHDSVRGFPVRFVYDDRQARTVERVRGQSELDESAERLTSRRSGLDDLRRRHRSMRAEHQRRLRGHQERVSAHNVAVRHWSERGDPDEVVTARLQASAEELRRERSELDALSTEIDEVARRIGIEEGTFAQAVEEHERRVRELEAAFPRTVVESGRYREAVHARDGRLAGVSREIRIYRFDGPSELPAVLAHELGHALGLDHVAAPDAVMSPQFDPTRGTAPPRRVHPIDIDALRSRCPELWSGGALDRVEMAEGGRSSR